MKYCISSLLLLFIVNAFAELPSRGSLMSDIEATYGAPLEISPAIGEPPITRWHYNEFTVIFEYEHVVHAFPRDIAVESLSAQNTGIVNLPPQDTSTESQASTADNSAAESAEPAEPFADDARSDNNSFFENTPKLIK